MAITKEHVLEVLADERLKAIDFSVGPIRVNWSGYGKAYDYIASGLVTIIPGSGSVALYDPPSNRFFTRKGNPPLSNGDRANVVHECTHIISDADKVHVTRMADEVAAYLAQYAYHRILDPSIGQVHYVGGRDPRVNLESAIIKMVDQYDLGKSAGRGKSISPSDIDDLSRVIHSDPDYNKVPLTELLAADGIDVPESTGSWFWKRTVFHDFYRRQLGRSVSENLQLPEEEVSTRSSSVAHENYVTYDTELLELFRQFSRGGEARQEIVKSKLVHIFLSIDQQSALTLRRRLSPVRRADVVSEQFHRTFPASVRSMLLDALLVER